MANKRQLKKHIAFVCGEIASECIVASHLIKGANSEALMKIVGKVAQLQSNAVKKINIAFDKTPRNFESAAEYNKARTQYFSKAYKALLDEFNAHVRDIVDEMNKALPNHSK